MYAENQRKDTVSRTVPSDTIKMHSMHDNRDFSTRQMKLKNIIQNAYNPFRHIKTASSKGAAQLFPDEFTDKDDAKTEFGKSFVRTNHFDQIDGVCQSDSKILSVREAGEASIKRLGEGANPKPHSILDKSITEKRLKDSKQLDETTPQKPTVAGVAIEEIEGYVGYWKDTEQEVDGVMTNKTELMGIIVTPELKGEINELTNEEHKDSCLAAIKETEETEESKRHPYIVLDKFGLFKTILGDDELPKFLYTGDYDIHEAYDIGGNLIPEGEQKAGLLNKLYNPAQPGQAGQSSGPITVDGSGNLQNVPRDAFMQHGDQATYRQSVRNELNAENERKGENESVIVLNPVVAVEETGKLAWFCIGERWYISKNRGEHQEARDEIVGFLKDNKNPTLERLAVPEEWKKDESLELGKRETKPYVKPYPGYKSGKTDEMYSFGYQFAPDFEVSPEIITTIKSKHSVSAGEDEEAQKMALKIARAKAVNLIISNYKGEQAKVAGIPKEKIHYSWTTGNETHFYNTNKKYDVTITGKTIKSFKIQDYGNLSTITEKTEV